MLYGVLAGFITLSVDQPYSYVNFAFIEYFFFLKFYYYHTTYMLNIFQNRYSSVLNRTDSVQDIYFRTFSFRKFFARNISLCSERREEVIKYNEQERREWTIKTKRFSTHLLIIFRWNIAMLHHPMRSVIIYIYYEYIFSTKV